jgi:hypothetical protein
LKYLLLGEHNTLPSQRRETIQEGCDCIEAPSECVHPIQFNEGRQGGVEVVLRVHGHPERDAPCMGQEPGGQDLGLVWWKVQCALRTY